MFVYYYDWHFQSNKITLKYLIWLLIKINDQTPMLQVVFCSYFQQFEKNKENHTLKEIGPTK